FELSSLERYEPVGIDRGSEPEACRESAGRAAREIALRVAAPSFGSTRTLGQPPENRRQTNDSVRSHPENERRRRGGLWWPMCLFSDPAQLVAIDTLGDDLVRND